MKKIIIFLIIYIAINKAYTQDLNENQILFKKIENGFKKYGLQDQKLTNGVRDLVSTFSKKEIDKFNVLFDKFLEAKYYKNELFEEYFGLLIEMQKKDLRDYILTFIINSENLISQKNFNFKNYLIEYKKIIENNILSDQSYYDWKFEIDDPKVFYMLDENFKTKFENCTLTCKSKIDEIIIYNSKGVYDFINKKIEFEEGITPWDYLNDLKFSNVKLGKTTINLNTSFFSTSSAKLYYPLKIEKEVEGKFEIRLSSTVREKNNKLCNFISFERLNLSSTEFQYDFNGIVELEGNSFYGSTNNKVLSILTFKKDGKPFIICEGDRILFREDKLFLERSNIKIILFDPVLKKEEYITAHNTNVEMNKDKKIIKISLDNQKKFSLFYSSSFHKLDISAQNLHWKYGSDSMWFTNDKHTYFKDAIFYSSRGYDENLFSYLSFNNMVHPFAQLSLLQTKLGRSTFSVEEFSNEYKMPTNEVRKLFYEISKFDFIHYNHVADEITVLQKIFNYTLATKKKFNFDFIVLEAEEKAFEPIATLYLDSLSLFISNVKPFTYDKKNTILISPDSAVKIERNLNMKVKGKVTTAKFDFYSRELEFNYDSFNIFIPLIDSIKVYTLKENEMDGTKSKQPVNSLMEKLKGFVYIDEPENKCGLKDNEEYPKFQNISDGFIYYKNVNTEFNKDTFFYKLEPFVVNKLNDIKDSNYKLKGKLNSGNIVPEINTDIVITKDLYFGFNNYEIKGEVPIYNGLGTIQTNVSLDGRGLTGNGKFLKFKKATYKDINFNFGLLNGSGFAAKYELLGTDTFPKTTSENVKFDWKVTLPLMYTTNTNKPFIMYNKELTLNGFTVYNDSLIGEGEAKVKSVIITSQDYRFKKENVYVEHANLKTDIEKTGVEFLIPDARLDLDWKQRSVYFEIDKAKDFYYSFGQNERVKVYQDPIKYNLDEDIISFVVKEKFITNSKPGFVEYNISKNDKLEFTSDSSKLDIIKKELKLNGVRDIKVADAEIEPKNQEIYFDNKAILKDLDSATIRIKDSKQKFTHMLTSAKISIISSKKYRGSALYTYIDTKGNETIINFLDVIVNEGVTQAKTTIKQENIIQLSPFFKYYGNIEFYGNNKYLTFKGGASMTHNCATKNYFIKIEQEIQPENIRILISDKTYELIKIYNGFYFNRFGDIYPVFYDKLKTFNDKTFVEVVGGYLSFDEVKNTYIIDYQDTDKGYDIKNGKISLNYSKCDIKYIGSLKNLPDINPSYLDVIINVDNKFETNINTYKMDFNVVNKFPKDIMNDLAANVKFNSLKNIINDTTFIKPYPLYLSEPSDYNKKFDTKLFIEDVELFWVPEHLSFISKNGNFTVSYIGGTDINKNINGYVHMSFKKDREGLTILMEPTKTEWLMFRYIPRFIDFASSYDKENTKIEEYSKKKLDKLKKNQENKNYVIPKEYNSDHLVRVVDKGIKYEFKKFVFENVDLIDEINKNAIINNNKIKLLNDSLELMDTSLIFKKNNLEINDSINSVKE